MLIRKSNILRMILGIKDSKIRESWRMDEDGEGRF